MRYKMKTPNNNNPWTKCLKESHFERRRGSDEDTLRRL